MKGESAMRKSKAGYAPHERGYFEQKPRKRKAYSAQDFTLLPDPVTDDIVANNISNVEFDYTYNGGDQI
jgi:hypothetical protein